MNVVLNPEILFLNNEEWNDEEKRDTFLERVFDLLDYIDNYPQMAIYWNVDFELLLWDAPVQHPWQTDRDFRIPMVKSIRTKLRQNRIEIEDAIIYDPCDTNSRETLRTEVLQMMHYCLDEGEKVFFVTKEKQENELFFSCEHSHKDTPYVVTNRIDFLKRKQIIEDLWPTILDEKDSFGIIVQLFVSETDSKQPLYNYEFTDSFIKSIIDHKNMGQAIASQIAKRLTMHQNDAQADSTLHDEFIGQTKERRMRVTGRPTSTRIHYEYVDKKTIRFKRFYGPGEHDKGL